MNLKYALAVATAVSLTTATLAFLVWRQAAQLELALRGKKCIRLETEAPGAKTAILPVWQVRCWAVDPGRPEIWLLFDGQWDFRQSPIDIHFEMTGNHGATALAEFPGLERDVSVVGDGIFLGKAPPYSGHAIAVHYEVKTADSNAPRMYLALEPENTDVYGALVIVRKACAWISISLLLVGSLFFWSAVQRRQLSVQS